ncbi:MAG: hypothetical protein WC242_00540 [Candidatus Paceibacterota bacterium]|jgi:hypothetical protein
MTRKCVRIFRVAQTGAWKPEEISPLEELLHSKATVLKNDDQNIFFYDIDFTILNVAGIKTLLVANGFHSGLFQVCEGELPDLSRQEEEKVTRTIIVEKDAGHEFGFTAYFADTPSYRYTGRTRSEAIGALIEHSMRSLSLEIEWSGNVVTQDYLRKLEDESWDDPDSFRDSGSVPLVP